MNTTFVSGLLALAVLAAGCGRGDDEAMGPAQRAGKAVDDAGVKISRTVEKELEKADEAAERARKKVKDAAADAARGLDKTTEQVGRQVERAGEKLQEASR